MSPFLQMALQMVSQEKKEATTSALWGKVTNQAPEDA